MPGLLLCERRSCRASTALEHIRDRRLVARRHDVDAGDAGNGGKLAHADSRQMLRPSAAGSAARSRRVDDRVRDDRAEQLFLASSAPTWPSAAARCRSGTAACGDAVLGEPRHDSGAPRRHPCRTGSARTRSRPRSWPCRLFGSQPARRIDRSVGRADEEIAPGRRPCAPDGSSPLSRMATRGLESARAVSRSNTGLASGWSPLLGIVAAQQQQIAHAERRRAHQIALQRDAVAVAAGELQDRLDAVARPGSPPPSPRRDAARAPAPSVTLTASARPLSGAALASRSSRVARHRRRDLRGDDEAAGGELVLQRHHAASLSIDPRRQNQAWQPGKLQDTGRQ